MNQSNPQLHAVGSHWLGKITPTQFLVVFYIYWRAALSPDRKVGEPVKVIAAATNLAKRTVQPVLQELANLGAVEIVSAGKEKTLVQIPAKYWLPPVEIPKTEAGPTTIPELIYRLCGHRPTPEILAHMRAAAGNDEQRLRHCLDSFFLHGKRWATLELLTVGVQHDLRSHGYFDEYWSRG